jgi:hypothetical protein
MAYSKKSLKINPFDDIRNENILQAMNYDIETIKANLAPKTFLRVYEGQGSFSIIRLTKYNKLEGLFIGDQDFYNDMKMVLARSFIENYTEVVPIIPLNHEWNPNY